MHPREAIKQGLERTRWSRTLVHAAVPSKIAQREEVSCHVAEFLSRGGEITLLHSTAPIQAALLESPRKPLPADEVFVRKTITPRVSDRRGSGVGIDIPEDLITQPQAAEILGVSLYTMTKMRAHRDGPPVAMRMHNAAGREFCLYSPEEVRDYKETHRPRIELTPIERDYRSPVPLGMMSTEQAAKICGMGKTSMQRRIVAGTGPHAAYESITNQGKTLRGFELADVLRWSATK